MKILHIITRLDKGGSAETVVYICEYFNKKEGYEIVLVYGGEIKVNLSCKNYYIKELKRKISLVNDIIAFLKIYKIIKKEKPDIIHTLSSKAGIIGRWAAWLARITSYKLQAKKLFILLMDIFFMVIMENSKHFYFCSLNVLLQKLLINLLL